MPALLSICIPTYNRAETLRQTLAEFTSNPQFDDEVELVISDNASTDNTQEVCMLFASTHPNIRYFRNEENLLDENFPIVLNHATGRYLKLLNDWGYMDESSLRFVKDCIRKAMDTRECIFFTNNWIFTDRKSPVCQCNSVDEYMQTISTFVTSNNIFGAWKEDWEAIVDKRKYSSLKLQQVDWSYQLVKMHGGCTLYDREILKTIQFERVPQEYHWFQVHLDNYYTILQPYIEDGTISPETFRQDKHYLLQHFTRELRRIYWLSPKRHFKFGTKGTWKLLMKYYRNDPYFWYFMFTLPFQKMIQKRHRRF